MLEQLPVYNPINRVALCIIQTNYEIKQILNLLLQACKGRIFNSYISWIIV